MPRFKVILAYDGTAYSGWQWQANGPSVQAAFEDALFRVAPGSSRVTASGRTDRGVHALAQVVSFETASSLSAAEFERALNAELPDDLVVHHVELAPDDFHPIRDAVRKRYRYVLADGPTPDVFRRQYCWYLKSRLDVDRMSRASRAWLGTHDFASFESSNSRRLSTVRTVYEIDVERSAAEPDLVLFEIEADGFLYNMVRTMVGTLVAIGRGQRPEHWAAAVLEARDRRQAGVRAPAQGLFLQRVEYLPGNAAQVGRTDDAALLAE